MIRPPRTILLLAGALLLALAVLTSRPRVKRRVWAAGLALMVAACGGSSVLTHSYQLSLSAVSAQSGPQTAATSGLPIAGATISVQP